MALDDGDIELPTTTPAASKSGVSKRYSSRPTASTSKTFVCRGHGNCNMTFSRSEHLARHVRKHTGERPFGCHCGKLFSRLDNLRQHAQTVHSDKPEQNEAMMKELTSLHTTLSSSNAKTLAPSAAPARPSRRAAAPTPATGPPSADEPAVRPGTSLGQEGAAPDSFRYHDPRADNFRDSRSSRNPQSSSATSPNGSGQHSFQPQDHHHQNQNQSYAPSRSGLPSSGSSGRPAPVPAPGQQQPLQPFVRADPNRRHGQTVGFSSIHPEQRSYYHEHEQHHSRLPSASHRPQSSGSSTRLPAIADIVSPAIAHALRDGRPPSSSGPPPSPSSSHQYGSLFPTANVSRPGTAPATYYQSSGVTGHGLGDRSTTTILLPPPIPSSRPGSSRAVSAIGPPPTRPRLDDLSTFSSVSYVNNESPFSFHAPDPDVSPPLRGSKRPRDDDDQRPHTASRQYYDDDESSRPPSRRLSVMDLCEPDEQRRPYTASSAPIRVFGVSTKQQQQQRSFLPRTILPALVESTEAASAPRSGDRLPPSRLPLDTREPSWRPSTGGDDASPLQYSASSSGEQQWARSYQSAGYSSQRDSGRSARLSPQSPQSPASEQFVFSGHAQQPLPSPVDARSAPVRHSSFSNSLASDQRQSLPSPNALRTEWERGFARGAAAPIPRQRELERALPPFFHYHPTPNGDFESTRPSSGGGGASYNARRLASERRPSLDASGSAILPIEGVAYHAGGGGRPTASVFGERGVSRVQHESREYEDEQFESPGPHHPTGLGRGSWDDRVERRGGLDNGGHASAGQSLGISPSDGDAGSPIFAHGLSPPPAAQLSVSHSTAGAAGGVYGASAPRLPVSAPSAVQRSSASPSLSGVRSPSPLSASHSPAPATQRQRDAELSVSSTPVSGSSLPVRSSPLQRVSSAAVSVSRDVSASPPTFPSSASAPAAYDGRSTLGTGHVANEHDLGPRSGSNGRDVNGRASSLSVNGASHSTDSSTPVKREVKVEG